MLQSLKHKVSDTAGGGDVAPLREAGNLCFYVKFPI